MVGSRISSSVKYVMLRFVGRGGPVALLGGLLLAPGFASLADINIPDPATVGTPTVLFSPSTPPASVKPVRSIAAPTPARPSSAVPAQTGTTKSQPPLAPVPAKLGPPPTPRPALPLDTGLQPLAAPPETPQSGDPGQADRQAAVGLTAR